MRGLKIIGEYILEFIIVIVLSLLSILTIIGFVPMVVGLTGYFSNKKNVRLFKDIFRTIKENWKIIIPYTIFQLIILIVPTLNIYFFNTHPESLNPFILAISYVVLVIGLIYLVTSSTIIVNMNVTFTQLLKNGIMLLFGNPIRSLIALAVMAGLVLSIIYFPYITIPLLYVVPWVVTILLKENFLKLKARALKTNVCELKIKEGKDDYLDEYGQINHQDENKGE